MVSICRIEFLEFFIIFCIAYTENEREKKVKTSILVVTPCKTLQFPESSRFQVLPSNLPS